MHLYWNRILIILVQREGLKPSQTLVGRYIYMNFTNVKKSLGLSDKSTAFCIKTFFSRGGCRLFEFTISTAANTKVASFSDGWASILLVRQDMLYVYRHVTSLFL